MWPGPTAPEELSLANNLMSELGIGCQWSVKMTVSFTGTLRTGCAGP